MSCGTLGTESVETLVGRSGFNTISILANDQKSTRRPQVGELGWGGMRWGASQSQDTA